MPTTLSLSTVEDHSSSDNMAELEKKIMLLGDIGVGKKARICRYGDREYIPDYKQMTLMEEKRCWLITFWLQILSFQDNLTKVTNSLCQSRMITNINTVG